MLLGFGVTRAAGGRLGALAHSRFSSTGLSYVLGGPRVFAGVTGLTRVASNLRLGRRTAWLAGAVCGIFGGQVGNQRGTGSAVLLGSRLRRRGSWRVLGTAGVIAGTILGQRVLANISQKLFRRTVAIIIPALGAARLLQPNL